MAKRYWYEVRFLRYRGDTSALCMGVPAVSAASAKRRALVKFNRQHPDCRKQGWGTHVTATRLGVAGTRLRAP